MSASANGLSSRTSRREDDRLLTGHGRYVDNVQHQGALYAAFVRSPYPSARIRSIESSEALASPGVSAVFTHEDLIASGFIDMPVPFQLPQGDGTFAIETPRPFLASERVLFVGEPVAMVLADTPSAALDGVERVLVDYEDLPALVVVDEALAPQAPQIWPERPGNIGFDWQKGDQVKVQDAFDASYKVVSLRSHISRVAAMPMEPRAALGRIDDDGRPVLTVSHQSPHQLRAELASRMGRSPTDLRVVVGDIGGSFGMKWGPLREEVLVFWATCNLQKSVRWTAQRNETFLSDEHARDVHVHAELGLDAQGHFTALRVRYDVNIGAYMSGRSVPPIANIGGISGVYTTPLVAARVVGVFTNTQTTTAYRGAGRPDATYTIERIIDVAAAEMGIDPAELRRRNMIPACAMPYQTSFLFRYDCGDFHANLNRALDLADYAGFPRRQSEAMQRGKLRGIGLAMPIEMAGGVGGDWATVQMDLDGGVTLLTGAMSAGQGHETPLVSLLSERLGIHSSKIRYRSGDTDLLANGKGNGGSSAMIMGSSAIIGAATDLVTKARALAAERLEVAASDVEFSAGEFRVPGTDLRVGWGDLAGAGTLLSGAGAFLPPAPTFPNGSHVSEVEIDAETGLVRVLSYVSVEDIGRVMHPMLVEGQIHGGVAQGLGQSLLEEIRYDHMGQLVTGSFMDYAMPRATDVPRIVSVNLEVPTALNPLGVKGVGEAGTIGALTAITNAVCNALALAGVRHLDMPATPLRVWEALRDAGYGPAVR